ncbi:homoserine dehydrogenase [Macrococcus brunensis]|uniref:Homoserine dehydrogenase n=1 Tax=Macrococcus brunensis TaxID=198483 RepID=A0A4R6BBW1_9STAP|nr:homoserine dehydrogenase [Macrococcus brunensis]
MINIALLGLGTVGSGVIKILEQNQQQLKDYMNIEFNIKHIYVKNINKKRDIDISNYHLTDNMDDILNDDLDIVIEVMGGIEPTVDYIRHFLNRGIHVVTANKDMLAAHLEELETLATKQQVALKYEASVAGGIPIVNAINNGLNANAIHHFMGIFNGTSNFILSKMTHDNLSFEEALQLATELGFAEADPTADVDGIDAQRKVVITSYLAFNTFIHLEDCEVTGIRDVTLTDIKLAEALGYRIKLIGQASYDGKRVQASVKPCMLSNQHQLAHVENEYNAIYVDGDAVGDTMFYGRGAGSLATGSAVVSDVMYIISQLETKKHTLPPHFTLGESQTADRKRVVVISEQPVEGLAGPHAEYQGSHAYEVNTTDLEKLNLTHVKIYQIEGAE